MSNESPCVKCKRDKTCSVMCPEFILWFRKAWANARKWVRK